MINLLRALIGQTGKGSFAWTQKDVNILFTSYLTPQSKIQIWTRVANRAIPAARQGPYAVVGDGKLYGFRTPIPSRIAKVP
jgi:hypothetical protein